MFHFNCRTWCAVSCSFKFKNSISQTWATSRAITKRWISEAPSGLHGHPDKFSQQGNHWRTAMNLDCIRTYSLSHSWCFAIEASFKQGSSASFKVVKLADVQLQSGLPYRLSERLMLNQLYTGGLTFICVLASKAALAIPTDWAAIPIPLNWIAQFYNPHLLALPNRNPAVFKRNGCGVRSMLTSSMRVTK